MSEKVDKLAELEKEIARVSSTLATLIIWMASSANSPISVAEAKKLMERL